MTIFCPLRGHSSVHIQCRQLESELSLVLLSFVLLSDIQRSDALQILHEELFVLDVLYSHRLYKTSCTVISHLYIGLFIGNKFVMYS